MFVQLRSTVGGLSNHSEMMHVSCEGAGVRELDLPCNRSGKADVSASAHDTCSRRVKMWCYFWLQQPLVFFFFSSLEREVNKHPQISGVNCELMTLYGTYGLAKCITYLGLNASRRGLRVQPLEGHKPH